MTWMTIEIALTFDLQASYCILNWGRHRVLMSFKSWETLTKVGLNGPSFVTAVTPLWWHCFIINTSVISEGKNCNFKEFLINSFIAANLSPTHNSVSLLAAKNYNQETIQKTNILIGVWTGDMCAKRGCGSTSLSKLALVNSSELSNALVAASLTLLLGSSFLMPCMMAVKIWLALSCRCSGSW